MQHGTEIGIHGPPEGLRHLFGAALLLVRTSDRVRKAYATLGIYFLQTFLLEILVNRLQVYVPVPYSYWAAPLLAVAELALCYGLVLLLRKTRILRLLILGEKSSDLTR